MSSYQFTWVIRTRILEFKASMSYKTIEDHINISIQLELVEEKKLPLPHQKHQRLLIEILEAICFSR